MLRKLMLSLFAAATMAGCGAEFGPCTEYGTYDQNGDAAVASTPCPEAANETDVVISDGGTN